MSNKQTVVKSAMPFTTTLFLIFLVLKLTNVIAWSWFWVTMPLWGGYTIIGLIVIVLLYIVIIKKI